MKKITFLLIALLVAMVSYSQIFIDEDFNGTTQPTGWSNFSPSSGGNQVWGFGSGVTAGADIANFTSNAAIFNDPSGSNVVFLYKHSLNITNAMNDDDYALIYTIRTSLNTFGSDNQPDRLSIKISDESFITSNHTIWSTTTEHDPYFRIFDIKTFIQSSWNLDLTQFRIGVEFDDRNASNGWGAGIDDVSFYARQYNDNAYNNLNSNYVISSLPYTYSQEADNQVNVANLPTGTVACGNSMTNGLWYKYVADFTGSLTIHAKADDYDVQVNAYHKNGSNLNCVGARDIYSSKLETLVIGVTLGQTYWFNVGHYSSGASASSVMHGTQHIWVGKTPSNDSCANALDFTSNAHNAIFDDVDLTGATNNSGFIAGCGSGMNDGIWYKFTAPYTGEYNFWINGYNFNVGVYSGSCNNFTCIAEYTAQGIQDNGFSVVQGTIYYFNIGDGSNTEDIVESDIIDIKFYYTPPANDICTNGTSLTVGTNFDQHDIIVNNLGTTETGGVIPNPTCGAFGSGQDLWCSVVVPSNGNVTIETSAFPGSPIADTVIAAYSSTSNTCSGLTQVSCNDDGGIGNFSKLILTGQTPGDTLFIRAFEFGNNTFGKFKISAYNTSTVAVADNVIVGLSLYPNPITNILNIDSQEKITQLNVYSILGKLVKTVKPNTTNSTIDLSNLETGIYMVKIEADNKVSTQKIVKK